MQSKVSMMAHIILVILGVLFLIAVLTGFVLSFWDPPQRVDNKNRSHWSRLSNCSPPP